MGVDLVRQVVVGQNIRVHYRILEGNKTRVQPYEGMVVAIKGSNVGRTFTVRRFGADGIGIERVFPFRSPNIEKIDIISKSKVRRSKIYYVRDLSSKSVRKIERA